MRLSWNRDEEGVITIYARMTDGRVADVADLWVKPMVEKFGVPRSRALELQEQFADLLVNSHNQLFTEAPSPETEAARLRNLIDCACNALTDSIKCSGNDPKTNLHFVRKLRRDSGTD